MKKKFTLALICLLILTVMLTSSYYLQPSAAAPDEKHKYWTMGGILKSCTQLGTSSPETRLPCSYWDEIPFKTRPWDLTPLWSSYNITFGSRDTTTGIVQLSVPKATYTKTINHAFLDKTGIWFKINQTLEVDGYGWLFTRNGTAAVVPDVDYKVFANDTGVYFYGPDGKHKNVTDSTWNDDIFAGNLTVSLSSGTFGTDGIPGTPDDPDGTWGDGKADGAGSSILIMPTTLHAYYWHELSKKWLPLFNSPYPQILTTGTANCTLIEPNSYLYPGPEPTPEVGRPTSVLTSKATGAPWEFLNGSDAHGYINETTGDPIVGPSVRYGHPAWNSYVKYACVWASLNVDTVMEDLDIIFHLEQRLVRDDCLMPDVNGDEVVDMGDIVINGVAFGAYDEGEVWWLNETSGEYEYVRRDAASSNFKAIGDAATHMSFDARGLIDMGDIVKMTVVFGDYLTEKGKQKP